VKRNEGGVAMVDLCVSSFRDFSMVDPSLFECRPENMFICVTCLLCS